MPINEHSLETYALGDCVIVVILPDVYIASVFSHGI